MSNKRDIELRLEALWTEIEALKAEKRSLKEKLSEKLNDAIQEFTKLDLNLREYNNINYSYSFNILVLSNQDNLKYIDDFMHINGFKIKLNIFHMDPTKWFSSNPDFNNNTFKKLQIALILYNNEYEHESQNEFELIKRIWTTYLCPNIKHQHKIPKYLLDVQPKYLAQVSQQSVWKLSQVSQEVIIFAKENNMECIHADVFQQFYMMASILEPMLQPILLYLVDGYLREYQRKHNIVLPAEIIQLCNKWCHNVDTDDVKLQEQQDHDQDVEDDAVTSIPTDLWGNINASIYHKNDRKKNGRRFSMGQIGKKALGKLKKVSKKIRWKKKRKSIMSDCYIRMD